MNTGDIIAWIFLAALLIITVFLCHERGMEDRSLLDRVAVLESQMEQKTVPRIYLTRGTVYAGGSEVVIEEIDVKESGK